MRYFLQLGILLAVLGMSAAFGADRFRLAQTQTAPALPPPQLLSQATAAGTCAITCGGDELHEYLSGLRPCLAGQSAVQAELHHAILICKQRCSAARLSRVRLM